MKENCRYFVPGPTWVRPEILAEMTRPMVGHRSAEFRELFGRVLRDTRELFVTQQPAFIATSSGTGVLEGALLNCVPRRVLVTTCGAFSERWLSIALRNGLEADHLRMPWGEATDPVKLADHLNARRGHYDAVTFTHSETSTGVLNDIAALAEVVHRESPGTLVLVDAVSSLGAAEIRFDDWKLDVCIASTQKGVALPPGLTLFAVSENAFAAAERKPYRGTYFDFVEYRKQAETNGAPFTPSIPHVYALAKQLDDILRTEGLQNRWKRHLAMRRLTRERVAPIGTVIAAEEQSSPSVSAIAPTNRPAADVVKAMKERGFTLGGGYGEWKDSSFRIGHMGDISIEDLDAMLDELVKIAS